MAENKKKAHIKPKISFWLSMLLTIIIVFLWAFFLIGYLQNDIALPWVFVSLIIPMGVISWLVYLSLPHGDYDDKDYYLWQVESAPSLLQITLKDIKKASRSALLSTFFFSFFVLVGLFFIGFGVYALFYLQDNQDFIWLYLLIILVGAGMVANFAFNAKRTPITPYLLTFDSARQLLTVHGFSRFARKQTQTVSFNNIKRVYAYSVRASKSGGYTIQLIRIDLINPTSYLLMNSGRLSDSIIEMRYYLEYLRAIFPDKINDELGGSGKLWIPP